MEYTREQERELLGPACSRMFEQLSAFITDHYNVDQAWDKGGKYGDRCLRYKRSGKSFCTFYFRKNQLAVWVVLGKEERERFDERRASFSKKMLEKYDATETLNDGKWLSFDVEDDSLLEDIKLLLLTKKDQNRELTMCGYCCDICKAYTKNQKKKDEREEMAAYWKEYFHIELPLEQICCDGCRSMKKDSHRIDMGCPVRKCVMEKGFKDCSDCDQYPCPIFLQRKGLNYEEANEIKPLDLNEYYANLCAFNNKSRLDRKKAEK